MRSKVLSVLAVLVLLLSACTEKALSIKLPEASAQAPSNAAEAQVPDTQLEPGEPPSREEVLAMRGLVLEGMTEEEIQRLTETVKSINLRMESDYLWKNDFADLEDPQSLAWNYFYEEGEIQVGWAVEWSTEECEAMWKAEGLTEQEFYEKYATPVKAYNDRNAESFVKLLQDLQETVDHEDLRYELQQVMDEISLAAAERDVSHVRNAYRILHDMDYYLLRYGPEDAAQYVDDDSTIMRYYGALELYAL